MVDIILKNFDNPDEIRNFDKGKFELVKLRDMTIGRASYEPGWKWSINVSPLSGTEFCEIEHLGMVISGSATVAFKNGEIHILKEGDLFHGLSCEDEHFSGFGEIYFTNIFYKSIKGWKKHHEMTLNLIVPVGSVLFYFVDVREVLRS